MINILQTIYSESCMIFIQDVHKFLFPRHMEYILVGELAFKIFSILKLKPKLDSFIRF